MNSCLSLFMTHRNMWIIEPGFRINRHVFESELCAILNQCNKRNVSCVFMQQYTIFLILIAILSQPSVAEYLERMPLRLGNVRLLNRLCFV